MVVILLILAALSPLIVLALLMANATVALIARQIVLALILCALSALWAYATVDFSDYFDGPMRISPELELLGTGRGLPPALNANGELMPIWWLVALAALAFAAAAWRATTRPHRLLAVAGLATIALSYAAIALLEAAYG